MKVHIYPPLPDGPDLGDGGIRQVIRAQYAWLPAYGWEIVKDPAEADVIASHIATPPAYLNLYGSTKPFVVHNHGVYWTPDYDWQGWAYDANAQVLENLRTADLTTAVSEWTAQALRRHSNRDIRVVHHGVDLEEWTPPESPGSYVLWNKTRVDPICDPSPVAALAQLLPFLPVMTTFLPDGIAPPRNVTVTGRLPFEEGKAVVRQAGVYLCTTRETFGIGTLEALACGVPVVGYAWGGQREIVRHGVDGWLVPPGDIAGLAEGVRWALETPEARIRARERAEQFPVAESIAKYAEIYQEVVDRFAERRAAPRTSIVVTAYKLERYLEDTLNSVLAQEDRDWECIVVDDASPDACGEIAERYAARDERFRVIHNRLNQYLAGARNTGIEAARGRYILPLDGDDMLTPNAVSTLAGMLDRYRGIHIAYGNVRFVNEDGKTLTRYGGHEPGHSGWPVEFRLDWMLEGVNGSYFKGQHGGQPMPYCSMFRREAWALTGGYRTRARSSEDCDMWLRTTSYGFRAEMVTQADTLVYRNREGSMSRDVGWEEHRPWYPWVRDHAALPAAAYRGLVKPDQIPLPALDPEIAVVIPVGPEHGRWVVDAVDSVDAQTFRLWECIVVNDSGAPLPRLPQWVRVIERPCEHCAGKGEWERRDESGEVTHGGACAECGGSGLGRFGGTAAARNAGIRAALAPLFLPLDADDYLQPDALTVMLHAHRADPRAPIVYSDFWDEKQPGEREIYETEDYDPRHLINRGIPWIVTSLTPVAYWREVGGFPEDVPWEDWAFALLCASRGYCHRRVAAPLVLYRKWTGRRREQNLAEKQENALRFRDWQVQHVETVGGELMACGSCPAGRSTTMMVGPMGGRSMAPAVTQPDGLVLVEYIGNKAGAVEYKSSVSGQNPYRFSATQRRKGVRPEDVEFFALNREFRVVPTEEIGIPSTAVQRGLSDPIVASGPPRPEAGRAQGESGLPRLAPPPAPEREEREPVGAAVAVMERPDLPANDLTRAVAELEGAPQENPEIRSLRRNNTRPQLDDMARELGHPDPSQFANAHDVAAFVVAMRANVAGSQ